MMNIYVLEAVSEIENMRVQRDQAREESRQIAQEQDHLRACVDDLARQRDAAQQQVSLLSANFPPSPQMYSFRF